MAVSTRSQSMGSNDHDQEQARMSSYAVRTPHHGLKEKLKSLTLFYEQHKLSSMAATAQKDRHSSRNPNPAPQAEATLVRVTPNSIHAPNTNSKNSIPNATVTRTFVDDAKENVVAVNGGDRIVGLSCPRKQPVSTSVARKLSLGSQMEYRPKTRIQNLDLNPSSKENINTVMAFVRLRPMMRKEKDNGARSCVKIVNRKDVYLTQFAPEHDYLRPKRLRGRHFTFDASFPESATQHEVYTATTSELVEAVLQGKNGSVFCYGATGAGKTYTMLGTVENQGVMVLAIKDLFTKIRQRSFDGKHVVHLSYLEVYNETVRDLLSPGRPLILREDKQGIVAAGLTQYRAYSTDEVMALLLQGNKNRTTEPTRANETSSRSHAILQVNVEYKTKDALMNIVNRMGKLSLIDLAGSERALATDQRTVRSIEGANINRSLLALSSCINALVEGKMHIPYRNSKLTQLLKDSLGGACNTVMIANISPCSTSFGETQNTLHWADRAKEIRNKTYDRSDELVPESDADQAKLLLEVQRENRELRLQLARQQQKLLALQKQSMAANSSSPAPNSATSPFSPPLSSAKTGKQRPRFTSSPRNGFTPEHRKAKEADERFSNLQQVIRAMEAEREKMKKDHAIQLKKKEEIIKQLSRKAIEAKGEAVKVMVTRASVRPKAKVSVNDGDIKIPCHRFHSPEPSVKKRSFWDITAAHSPSVSSLNGRKTRSHNITTEATGLPPRSMLPQPGYARYTATPYKR